MQKLISGEWDIQDDLYHSYELLQNNFGMASNHVKDLECYLHHQHVLLVETPAECILFGGQHIWKLTGIAK